MKQIMELGTFVSDGPNTKSYILAIIDYFDVWCLRIDVEFASEISSRLPPELFPQKTNSLLFLHGQL